MKVDFVICGAQKGGTSALDVYLRSHPEICMAKEKEVHFFDRDGLFENGPPDYSIYHESFSPEPTHKMVGEASPSYMYWYDAPRRMWQYNPDMKLIVVLRNPMERAYSHWNMQRGRKQEALSFWDAIQRESKRCRHALPYQHRFHSYVDRGFYMEQLRRLWHYFPKEQVLVIKNENMRKKPGEALRMVCNFLGVDEFPAVETQIVHSRRYAFPLSDRERAYLRQVYEYDIRSLERVLGWDCRTWLL